MRRQSSLHIYGVVLAALCGLAWAAAAAAAQASHRPVTATDTAPQAVESTEAAPHAAGPPPERAAPAPAGARLDVAAELALGDVRLSSLEAARRAVASAPSLASARAATASAKASAAAAFLQVYPTVTLEARYVRTNQASVRDLRDLYTTLNGAREATAMNRGEPTPEPLVLPVLPNDTYSLLGEVDWSLSDLVLTVLPRYEAAMGRVRFRELQELAKAREVALRAQETFWAYARIRAAHVVARAGVSLYTALREDVEGLVRAGALAQVELLRARAQVAAAEVAVANVEAQRAQALSQLSVLLGDPLPGDVAIGDSLGAAPPPVLADEASLRARALAERSDLRSLRALSAAYDDDIGARRADGLPKLGIGASGQYENPNRRVQTFYNRWDSSWSAYASLRWIPNELLLAGRGADRLRADRAQVRADIRALERAVTVEVTRAHATYRAARSASAAAQAGIDAAEESYRIRQAQFRAGSAVATDVIDAEEKLRRARLDLVNATIDLRVAQARLERVVEAPLGAGLE